MIARGGEQAGHTDAIGFQLQRIDQAAIDTTQQHADWLQPAERLKEQAAIAHREVAAFDQAHDSSRASSTCAYHAGSA